MKKVTFAAKPAPAKKNEASADDWVGMANKPIPDEPMKRLTIDVPLSLHQRIKCTCALEGTKMADEIRELLSSRFPPAKNGAGRHDSP